MRLREPLVLVALAAVATSARPAGACGPDFPTELLADRGANLAELPEGIFVDEVAALVPAPERYRDPCQGLVAPDAAADEPTQQSYASELAACGAARGRATPGAIEAALYARGAELFHGDDPRAAAPWFVALLALPAPLRPALSTSAAYSLGRLYVGDNGRGAYRRVRALVDVGFVDPDGLAAASLLAEARLTDDPGGAIPLLAARAALGYRDAKDQLLSIVRDAIRTSDEPRLLRSAPGQRLLGAYLYSRDGELTDGERARLWAAIAATPRPAGADRLAAAAYRNGDWSRATALVGVAEDSALGRWVQAKLAARAGDAAGAADLACSAAVAMPTASDCPDFICGAYLARDRALGDCAMLELAADRPVSAMRHAWQAHHRYRDALYIADRVLTTAELRGFLDEVTAQGPDAAISDDDWFFARDTLGTLYGRRLMREGRFVEATPWLPDGERSAALVYAEYQAIAEVASDRLQRAEALFRASLVARFAGMEIMGTAHGPDWAIEGGGFDLDEYTEGPDSGRADYDQRAWDEATDDVEPRHGPSRWVTAAETARVAASAPADPRRFHYRYRAAELARQAAALVPAYAQAHDALACWADSYPDGHSQEYLDELRAFVLADAAFPEEGCAAPDFAQARHARPPRRHTHARPTHHWWHRYPRWVARARSVARVAVPLALAAMLVLVVHVVRRRRQRGAAVP